MKNAELFTFFFMLYTKTKVCFMTYGIFCMAGRRKIRKQGEARCALNG